MKALGEDPSLLLPSFWSCVPVFSVLGLQLLHSSLCLYILTLTLFLFMRTLGKKPTLFQYNLISTKHICSNPFPNQITF